MSIEIKSVAEAKKTLKKFGRVDFRGVSFVEIVHQSSGQWQSYSGTYRVSSDKEKLMARSITAAFREAARRGMI